MRIWQIKEAILTVVFLWWRDSWRIEDISLILGYFFFKFVCWTIHVLCHYVKTASVGGHRWWLWHNTSPKMLARNCKRCMVRFYLILVRYWMGICGHTFTTSDQDSCVSTNHTRVIASMTHVCDLLLQWCHPCMRMFHASGARTFLSVQILPLHMNFLLCFFFQK